MNYRHAFHAGNFADVLKHVVLMMLVEHLKKKPAPSPLGRQKLVSIVESDGYAALKAQLPPRENRGLVLIDPPFESDTEFDRILSALASDHAPPTASPAARWKPLVSFLTIPLPRPCGQCMALHTKVLTGPWARRRSRAPPDNLGCNTISAIATADTWP